LGINTSRSFQRSPGPPSSIKGKRKEMGVTEERQEKSGKKKRRKGKKRENEGDLLH